MNRDDYLKLCQQAQNNKNNLDKDQQEQIKKIYNDMFKNLSENIKSTNPDSLTERYLEELQIQLAKEIKLVNSKVKNVIKINIGKSSKLASNVQLDFFMQLNEKYNLDMGNTFSSMFSKIPKQVVEEMIYGQLYKDRLGLSKRIWKHTKKFEKDIDYIITEGIANKKPIYEIAKDLEIYVKPKASKPWGWSKVYPSASGKVDYNAQRLARTSINQTFQQAQKRSCSKNPFVTGIQWLTSNSHRTCELCNSRNGVVYTINDLPLDHPNGMCTTIPVLEKELDQIGEELRNWLDGESNPKLDKWYSKYGGEFSNASINKEKLELKHDNSDILSSKKWLDANFSSQKKFEAHFKHLKEYNNITPEEYLKIARELLAEPLSNDVDGFVGSQGWVFKYRKSTNDFALGHPKGTISTLFKPDIQYEYWLSQIKQFKGN